MRKFKVGDSVRCLRSFHDYFTRGKSYEVASVTNNGMFWTIDNKGRLMRVVSRLFTDSCSPLERAHYANDYNE